MTKLPIVELVKGNLITIATASFCRSSVVSGRFTKRTSEITFCHVGFWGATSPHFLNRQFPFLSRLLYACLGCHSSIWCTVAGAGSLNLRHFVRCRVLQKQSDRSHCLAVIVQPTFGSIAPAATPLDADVFAPCVDRRCKNSQIALAVLLPSRSLPLAQLPRRRSHRLQAFFFLALIGAAETVRLLLPPCCHYVAYLWLGGNRGNPIGGRFHLRRRSHSRCSFMQCRATLQKQSGRFHCLAVIARPSFFTIALIVIPSTRRSASGAVMMAGWLIK